MTDSKNKSYLLAFINCVEGSEKEFNDWYNNVHLHEVIAVEGILSAQRFTLVEKQIEPEQPYRYLAIYEVESGREAEAADNLNAAIPSMNMSELAQFDTAHSMIVRSISDLVQ